ncbi:hypothetical protein DOY81_005856 [Sarcophaga bullata]|nr:hypothetical protein DOY81_005856 [Sarcophaga bullata]
MFPSGMSVENLLKGTDECDMAIAHASCPGAPVFIENREILNLLQPYRWSTFELVLVVTINILVVALVMYVVIFYT